MRKKSNLKEISPVRFCQEGADQQGIDQEGIQLKHPEPSFLNNKLAATMAQ